MSAKLLTAQRSVCSGAVLSPLEVAVGVLVDLVEGRRTTSAPFLSLRKHALWCLAQHCSTSFWTLHQECSWSGREYRD